MPSTPPWLAAAEAMLNRGIDASSEAEEVARRLDSTSLQIEAVGLISVRAAVHAGRLALSVSEPARESAPGSARESASDGIAADAVISGSMRGMIALLRETRPTAPQGRATLSIRGDAEIANLYRQLFSAARPDLEEELSRWVGDAPARQLSRVAGGMLNWAQRTQRVIGENVAEYLKEESRDLVATPEVEEFLEGVDQVREAADRIEARLQGLQRRLGDKV